MKPSASRYRAAWNAIHVFIGMTLAVSDALKIPSKDQQDRPENDERTRCPSNQKQTFGEWISSFARVVELCLKVFLSKTFAKLGTQRKANKSGKRDSGKK